ncbi:MAG TPA: hypothetical protein VK659_03000 [Asanoa sp.]|nr:hypothetical protein [Asanoa sp.]
MIEKIKRFADRRNRDRGASATEYALIMGFIVAGLIAILFVFGPAIARQFNNACDRITPADSCVAP